MQIHNQRQIDEQEPFNPKYLLVLLVLCVIINFYGLGRVPLLGPDEPRYAEIARAMYETGDWITPRLAGINWFEKPALTYWIAAAGYQIFGVSEFAARFGIAAMASFGVLLLYIFGKRIGDPRLGYLSAAVLMTTSLWAGFGRATTFDLPLSVAIEMALLSFYLWERGDEQQGKHLFYRNLFYRNLFCRNLFCQNLFWWIFCFSVGLAFLAKGLVGILLPLAIAGLYLLLTGRLKVIFRPGLLIMGTLIFVTTAAT